MGVESSLRGGRSSAGVREINSGIKKKINSGIGKGKTNHQYEWGEKMVKSITLNTQEIN